MGMEVALTPLGERGTSVGPMCRVDVVVLLARRAEREFHCVPLHRLFLCEGEKERERLVTEISSMLPFPLLCLDALVESKRRA